MDFSSWTALAFKFVDVFSEYYLMSEYWRQYFHHPNEPFTEYREYKYEEGEYYL